MANGIAVILFFVNIEQGSIDEFFWACGDSSIAGPFISSAGAVEWRDEYSPGGEIWSQSNDEEGVCNAPALRKDSSGQWVRGQ
jgi:hypothetical protein